MSNILTAILRSNRGIALLVTLSVITVVIAAVMELNRRVHTSVTSMGTTRDRLVLSHMAASGIHGAMAMLVEDRMVSTTDTVQEDWANPEKVAEVLSEMPFEDGRVSVTIMDETAKIQINALAVLPSGRSFNNPQYQLWSRLLTLALAENETLRDIETSMVINSVKDWLDSGDDDAITGLNGAETDYYESLDPPYECRNGPFTHIGELLLVRGVTPELFYLLGEDQNLSNFLTVHGMEKTKGNTYTYKGKINISTADVPVIAALLPAGYEMLAPILYEYRIEKAGEDYSHDLSSPTWYKGVLGVADVGIDPNLVTTSSNLFRVVAVAVLNDVRLTTTAVVERQRAPKSRKWQCRIIDWQAG